MPRKNDPARTVQQRRLSLYIHRLNFEVIYVTLCATTPPRNVRRNVNATTLVLGLGAWACLLPLLTAAGANRQPVLVYVYGF